MTAKPAVGFVGLGMMGAPMAARLVRAGYFLYVHDADSQRSAEFSREHGASVLREEDTGRLEVLITMLPGSAVVEAVVLGDGPAGAKRLRKGATVIDMSSSEPTRSRALGVTLNNLGLAYLDAPVSGGKKRAVDGSLAILVGGAVSLLDAHRPLLSQMGSSILHIGPNGAGHAAKALNNYVSAAGLIASIEALHTAQRFGIDPAIMTDVLNASTGRNNTSENKIKQFMLSGTFASGFALHLMDKDLKIALSLARELSMPMKLGEECVRIWSEAAGRSGPTADHTEMYRLLG